MLKQDYTPPFLAYLTTQDEAGLRRAYELGRHAMRRSVGLLDLVRIHNEVFLEVIGTARTPESAQDVARAADVLGGSALLVRDDPARVHGCWLGARTTRAGHRPQQMSRPTSCGRVSGVLMVMELFKRRLRLHPRNSPAR